MDIYKTILEFVNEVLNLNPESNHWLEKANLVRSFVELKQQFHPCDIEDHKKDENQACLNVLLKKNIISAALDHKKTCNSPNCGVSTYWLMALAKQAGIEFTSEESVLFL